MLKNRGLINKQAQTLFRQGITIDQGLWGGWLGQYHKALRVKLHHVAEARGCSINQLVNSGLAAYYSNEQTGKRGASSRPTRQAGSATYDKMSPDERQQLVEELAGLAGFEEGPKDAFPDGTRYEYDSRFKTTFEITPSGKRFPVALVAGRFQRDLANAATRKTAREDTF